MLWLTIVVFVGLLLLLVLAHEWGHFIVAKKAGCDVEEFGFGFPPRLFSWNWHGTRYSFNLLPIGGFVKISGEDMEEKNPGPRSFASKSAGWRIAILSAGVTMNAIVAIILLSIQGVVGVPVLVTEENQATLTNHLTYIVEVAPNSPAAEAGMKEMDRIVRLDEVNTPLVTEVQTLVSEKAGNTVEIEIERQGQHQTLTLTPRVNPPAGEGALGVSLASTGLMRVPWWQAPWHGLARAYDMLRQIIIQFSLIIGRLFQGGGSSEALTGPIGIAIYTNEVTKLGLSYVLEFGALISLNLALINILPIPALDGGRIMFVVFERVFGRRFPGKIEQLSHTVGFVALILLMLLITFKDIQRFF
jgi:regulator of sigma E protease